MTDTLLRAHRRALLSAAVVGLATLLIGRLGFGGIAAATTGPGDYQLYPPLYKFPRADMGPWAGRYVSTSSARKSKIISSQINFTIEGDSGIPIGEIALYMDDVQSSEQALVLTLYNLREVHGTLQSDIVGVTGKPIVGHLWLSHVPASHNLTGKIWPPSGGGPFAISYRYIGTDPNLKRATSYTAKERATSYTAKASRKPPAGAAASAQAGIFASVARAAARLVRGTG